MLDLSLPLPDISADEPAGPNLEFDTAFAELEREAQGKPEQQYGSTIIPAEEPDWKLVVAGALDLLGRTYDLRVLAQLAVGGLQREGAPGYAAVLGAIRQLLEQRWPQVHPQLDPEDDNDPTLRANALLAVAHPVRVLRFLRTLPLARSTRAGTVCWRDIAAANGTIELEEGTPPMGEAVIAAAFRESDPAGVAALGAALGQAADHAAAIPAAFDGQAGHGTGPDFEDLVKLLRDMGRMVGQYAQHTGGEPDAEPVAEQQPEPGAAPAAPAPAARRNYTVADIAAVDTRADAVRLLELSIAYYERHEPSSPLPLLLRRACRLAEMSFLDIVRDLAPDGLGQAERVFGTSQQY